MNLYYQPTEERKKHLLIFFNGWGCNETILSNINIPEFDLLIISDYTKIDEEDLRNLSILSGYYETRYIMAWSFGVFMACECLPYLPCIKRLIAINGTPWPIDDKRGIPLRIFNATLANYLTEENRRLFLQRVLGNYTPTPALLHALKGRSIEHQRTELEALFERALINQDKEENHDDPTAAWTHAIISESDKIFPPRNMKKAWGEKAILLSGDHFPDFPAIINQFILP